MDNNTCVNDGCRALIRVKVLYLYFAIFQNQCGRATPVVTCQHTGIGHHDPSALNDVNPAVGGWGVADNNPIYAKAVQVSVELRLYQDTPAVNSAAIPERTVVLVHLSCAQLAELVKQCGKLIIITWFWTAQCSLLNAG